MKKLILTAVVFAVACGSPRTVVDEAKDSWKADGKDKIQCTTGQTSCDGGCVDLVTDEANCGACGKACAEANGFRCFNFIRQILSAIPALLDQFFIHLIDHIQMFTRPGF